MSTISEGRKQYVVGFLFAPGRYEVVLIRKNRPEWQAGKLNGVGGKIEPGETPLEAMRREFREETGADIKDWTEFATIGIEDRVNVVFFSACAHSQGRPFIQTMTDEPVEWFRVSAIQHLETIENLKWLIPMILDRKNIRAKIECFPSESKEERMG